MNGIEVRPGLWIPEHELEESASRSGGPGGQHVNKTSTRVTLRWSLVNSTALTDAVRARLLARLARRLTAEGDLIVVVDESRSQHANREEARERMARILREALVVQRPRIDTKPTRSSQRKRVAAKKHRSAIKAGRGSVDED